MCQISQFVMLLARSLCHYDHFYAAGDEIGEHGMAVVQVFAAVGEQGQLTHELFVLTAFALCINDAYTQPQFYFKIALCW